VLLHEYVTLVYCEALRGCLCKKRYINLTYLLRCGDTNVTMESCDDSKDNITLTCSGNKDDHTKEKNTYELCQ